MFNKATLLGNMGADPEVRTLSSGTQITNFPLATNERWTDKSGEKKEKTTWHKIVVIGGLSNFLSEYAYKGDKVFVEGKIQHSKWIDKEGNDRYSSEIIVTPNFGAVRLLSKKKDDEFHQDTGYDGEQIPF